MNTPKNAFYFFLGWSLLITLLIVLTNVEPGKRITYYVLWLAIVLLVVTHYQEILSIFQNAGFITPDTIGQGQQQT